MLHDCVATRRCVATALNVFPVTVLVQKIPMSFIEVISGHVLARISNSLPQSVIFVCVTDILDLFMIWKCVQERVRCGV